MCSNQAVENIDTIVASVVKSGRKQGSGDFYLSYNTVIIQHVTRDDNDRCY